MEGPSAEINDMNNNTQENDLGDVEDLSGTKRDFVEVGEIDNVKKRKRGYVFIV